MSDPTTMERFSCSACERTFAWKLALAGKRVKCKCGETIHVPAEIAPRDESDDASYDFDALADLDARAAEKATARDQQERLEQPRLAPIAEIALPQKARAIPAIAGNPIGYAPGMTQRQRDRAAELDRSLMDAKRDVIAPLILLVGGLVMYVCSYTVAFKLSTLGILGLTFGVSTITAIKAILLVIFAIAAAGPLGVSFGGVFTATLKLAAIAVFSDGCNACLIASLGKVAHGFGLGIATLPVSLTVYWTLLTFLFSMDASDSALVVIVLSTCDFILRTLLAVLLAEMLLGHPAAAAMGGLGSAKTVAAHVSPQTTYVNQLHDFGLLHEAKAYVAAGHQAFIGDTVNQIYAAGAPNVWFEVTRDINGKGDPVGVYVDMPDSPTARQKILTLRKTFYDANNFSSSPSILTDNPSEQYLSIRLK